MKLAKSNFFAGLIFSMTASMLLATLGCGGKGSTSFSYSTPGPVGITFAVDGGGNANVSGGFATLLGRFSVNHSFSKRSDYSYIILRDRNRGTDQVFKISKTGYLEVKTSGEHVIRVEQADDAFVLDIQQISGTFEVTAYPSDTTIARIDFGPYDPDIVVTKNRNIIVEHWNVFRSNQTISIDSLKSVQLNEQSVGTGPATLVFNWKDTVEGEPIEVSIQNSDEVKDNFAMLRSATRQVSYGVDFNEGASHAILIFLLICPGIPIAMILLPIAFSIYSANKT